jgi:hypothetical protein
MQSCVQLMGILALGICADGWKWCLLFFSAISTYLWPSGRGNVGFFWWINRVLARSMSQTHYRLQPPSSSAHLLKEDEGIFSVMTEQLKKELKKLCYDVENFFGFLTLCLYITPKSVDGATGRRNGDREDRSALRFCKHTWIEHNQLAVCRTLRRYQRMLKS